MLNKTENSKIFVTSDTFIGRTSALKLETRNKFKTVQEMNSFIIDSWNSRVSNNDIVYHLGYFAHDSQSTAEALEKLNGHIVFLNNKFEKLIFDVMHIYKKISTFDSPIIEIPEKNVLLSYYPLEVWENKDTIHLYGFGEFKHNLNIRPNKLNVSYDIWGYPVLIDDCIDSIKTFNEIFDGTKYELIKDLPNVSKGVIYTRSENFYYTKTDSFFNKIDVSTVETNEQYFKKIDI